MAIEYQKGNFPHSIIWMPAPNCSCLSGITCSLHRHRRPDLDGYFLFLPMYYLGTKAIDRKIVESKFTRSGGDLFNFFTYFRFFFLRPKMLIFYFILVPFHAMDSGYGCKDWFVVWQYFSVFLAWFYPSISCCTPPHPSSWH